MVTKPKRPSPIDIAFGIIVTVVVSWGAIALVVVGGWLLKSGENPRLGLVLLSVGATPLVALVLYHLAWFYVSLFVYPFASPSLKARLARHDPELAEIEDSCMV